MSSAGAQFGMIGLAVMGRNLALNVEEHGFPVAVWNLEPELTQRFMAENRDRRFTAAATLEELVRALERPRRIMMMIKAGAPVDATLEKLAPLLDPGDVVVDGGNSWFQDTRRREAWARARNLQFVGVGVSGGEDGARHGPSLMPGGPREAWERLRPVWEAIAAKTESGPCVTHVGPDGAGHFVKMVHNGIEYGDMQLIAEAYDLLGRVVGLSADAAADVFERWNRGPLESFLIEITARILRKKDPETGRPLVELVRDEAGQKGTGKWTAQVALDLGVPIPTIASAIDARVISSLKPLRERASRILHPPAVPPHIVAEGKGVVDSVEAALYAAKVCSYAQGMSLIAAGSREWSWGIDLSEMARIWKGGCIIRARLLNDIMNAFQLQPALERDGAGAPAGGAGGGVRERSWDNLLLDGSFAARVAAAQDGWRRVVALAQTAGVPVPALSASLAYYDGLRTARLPQNLTQAQRDAFGAHTYQREDRPEAGFVHTDWLG
jgi:6-phosphogluconate dehydrogenase